MAKIKRLTGGIYFILFCAILGILVGFIISSYHAFSARSLENFLLRPLIGFLCGICISSIHLFLLWTQKIAFGDRYGSKPALQALQFILIMCLYFCISGYFIKAHFTQDTASRFSLHAIGLLISIVILILFLYQAISERISLSLSLLEKYHLKMIYSLVTILETRDPSKEGHSKRVADGCELLGRRFGLPERSIEKLKRAALMHDLGMIFIDESLVVKESALTPGELAQIRMHPFIVQRILAPLNILSWETEIIKASQLFIYSVDLRSEKESRNAGVSPLIKTYFEYSLPGKRPEDLPLEARILSAVDFYDTLTHPRPYRNARTHGETMEQMYAESGTRFDRQVVRSLEEISRNGGWSSQDCCGDKLACPEEAKILKEIQKTARNLTYLNIFSQFAGRRDYLNAGVFLFITTGSTFLSAMIGLIISSTTANPFWIKLFFIQGLITGAVVFLLGIPIERNLPVLFVGRMARMFLSYAACGLFSSLITLCVILNPAMGWSGGFDGYSALFAFTTMLISGAFGLFFDILNVTSQELIRDQKKLQNLFFDLICALCYALEAADPYTKGHSEKVSIYSKRLGECLSLSPEMLEMLERAALLHDIGKIGIDRSIINKPARLTDQEFAIIKTHTTLGAKTLEPFEHLWEISILVRSHHERFDGKGYPEKRREADIPLFSRIIAIADTYDAMVSDRPYRKGLSSEVAIAELRRCAGTQFDPDLIEPFIKTLRCSFRESVFEFSQEP